MQPIPESAGAGELAAVIYEDARSGISGSADLVLLLDLAIAQAEFEAVTGDDFGSTASLDAAMQVLRTARGVGPWLYGGLAHVAWTALRVAGATGHRISGLSRLDDAILAWIDGFPDDSDVDLPSGLLGIGVYALGHPDRVLRETMTAGILDVVARRVERDPDGGVFTRVVDNELRRLTKPHMIGHRDLGVAHGSAGLVSFLGSAAMSGLGCSAAAGELLDEALGWLLRQGSGLGGSHVFPYSVEARYEPARSAWCYGDPGTALALGVAASGTRSPELSARAAQTANAAGRAALDLPPARAGVVDAGLCHGAAGLCWFGRRAVECGLPGAAEYEEHWTDEVRRQRRDGPLHYVGKGGAARDHSFLEGDLGVALVLLYLDSGRRPAWEQRLLGTPVLAPAAV